MNTQREWYFEFFIKWSDFFFVCVAVEDLEMNDGTADKPYFMSKGLMSILGKKNLKPGEKKKCCGCCWSKQTLHGQIEILHEEIECFLTCVYTIHVHLYITIYAISESIIELQEFVIMQVHNCPLLAIVCYWWDYSFILYS